MGMFKLTTSGSWWTTSKDERWRSSGTDDVGGFVMPAACAAFIEAKKAELGEEPPADLAWHYMKD